MGLKRWIAVMTALALVITAIYICGHKKEITEVSNNSLKSLPIIVVDAGHGGIDGGTSGFDGTPEKEINLLIAKKLEDILVSCGFEVVMTRREDDLISDPSLPTIRQRKRQDILKRLSIAEETEACVLISIHQNYYENSYYNGAQVFYSKNHADSFLLAQNIQDQIVRHIQPDNSRQIKKVGSEIYLLDQCKNPAVMVECGFMSNQKELSLLKNEDYQTKIALVIACSLIEFYT